MVENEDKIKGKLVNSNIKWRNLEKLVKVYS